MVKIKITFFPQSLYKKLSSGEFFAIFSTSATIPDYPDTTQ